VREVSSAAITIMMTAISPGTMKFFDSSSSLNQTRERTSSGPAAAGMKDRATPSAYPRAIVAVFASEPSSRNWTGAGGDAFRRAAKSYGITTAARTSRSRMARSISG